MTAPPRNLAGFLAGDHTLPAGAIPLADDGCCVVCLMPDGEWVSWDGFSLPPMGSDPQREVLNAVIASLGGTAKALADRLGISVRTVESWRAERYPLPHSSAFQIAHLLAEK